MSPGSPSPNGPHRAPAETFQTHRQLEIYRSGPSDGPEAVPASPEALQEKARARLTPEVYEWVAGGAGAGGTIQANRAAFDRYRIVPRMLRDVARRDLGVDLLGRRAPSPLLVAPIGVQGLLHPEGEVATARAAASIRVPFILSSVSSRSMEEVAEAMGAADRWFQLYWPRCPDLALSFLQRAERAGYQALVVTLDTQTMGWRERNLDHGYLPFLHGEGLANYRTDPIFQAGLPAGVPEPSAVVEHYLKVFSDLSYTWEDLRFLRGHTRLPILVKGVQHPDDARRALDQGMDGIIVSNHGGRQVEGGVATLDVLPGIVRAAAERVPVLFDSGARRGADVFKALALGARAVLVGRPCMWALAVGGEQGVRDQLRNLLADLDVTFALCGKRSVAEIDRADLLHVDGGRPAGRRGRCRSETAAPFSSSM